MKYYSFDIFDTCFLRSCGRLDLLFDILAMGIIGINCDNTF